MSQNALNMRVAKNITIHIPWVRVWMDVGEVEFD